jgi:hypothetical protein
MIDDSFEAVGHVRIIKRSVETGEVVFDKTFKNQITNYACQQAALMWAGVTSLVPSQIAVGIGTNAAGTSPNDQALWSEVSGSRQSLDYATTFLNYYVQYAVTYDQTEVLGTITGQNPTGQIVLSEAGLFDSQGNLWSHVPLNNVTHDNTTTLSIQWQVLMKGN